MTFKYCLNYFLWVKQLILQLFQVFFFNQIRAFIWIISIKKKEVATLEGLKIGNGIVKIQRSLKSMSCSKNKKTTVSRPQVTVKMSSRLGLQTFPTFQSSIFNTEPSLAVLDTLVSIILCFRKCYTNPLLLLTYFL